MLFQCWASVEDGVPTLKQLWDMVLIRAQTAITFRQTAVTAYFRSTQLLLFAFARQRIGGEKLL